MYINAIVCEHTYYKLQTFAVYDSSFGFTKGRAESPVIP